MKARVIEVGNIQIAKEQIWCYELGNGENLVKLPVENGEWSISVLQTSEDSALFGKKNIAVMFVHEHFPFDLETCIDNFYNGREVMDANDWVHIEETLSIDTGSAVFCNDERKLFDVYNVNNDEIPELSLSFKEEGIETMTGFGDGKYTLYDFMKTKENQYYPMMVIADYMIFSDSITLV